jgi:hypothetical protein
VGDGKRAIGIVKSSWPRKSTSGSEPFQLTTARVRGVPRRERGLRRERKKKAACRARSAPGSAADSSAVSCSSASGSILAADVSCGHGRASGTNVSAREALLIGTGHGTYDAGEGLPGRSGAQRGAARADEQHTEERGQLCQGRPRSASASRPFMDTREGCISNNRHKDDAGEGSNVNRPARDPALKPSHVFRGEGSNV